LGDSRDCGSDLHSSRVFLYIGLESERRGERMAFDRALAERIRECLARRKGVEEKTLFGCACFLLGGNVLVGVWKDSLIARVGPDGYEDALLEPHVKEFDITGRPMTGWVRVGPRGVEDDGQLSDWIRRSLRLVSKLPAA
jgi:hypothetical protein